MSLNDLRITIIQTEIIWENKQENLRSLRSKLEKLCGETDLVVLPEMFSTGFSMRPETFAESMNGATIEWMRNIAQTKNVVLTGSLMIKDNNLYFNRLVWILPNGEIGYYDKRHLFGFGKEDEHYTCGKKRLMVSVNGWKINLQVCYDLRFPVWARQNMQENQGNPEYDVLINVANWPEKRSHAWKSLLIARAIENQCYVIGVNRVGYDGKEIYHSGDSMAIGPLGEILFEKSHDECVFTIALDKTQLDDVRNQFPFLRDADYFSISE